MNLATTPSVNDTLATLKKRRQGIVDVRERGRQLFERGATGTQVASALSDGMDAFLIRLIEEEFELRSESERDVIRENAAVVAVGGTGRGDLCPYSDIDLLFLYDPAADTPFAEFSSTVVRALWDAGLQLGHSVRTIKECVTLAKAEPQIATALTEMRLLWGSERLVGSLRKQFERKVIHRRLRAFIDSCVEARGSERLTHGNTVQQLEPDLKSSQGGLRDFHLLRWLGYALFKEKDIDSLRRNGSLTREEAYDLRGAYEFLLKIRIDMHFHNNREQDRLTRDEQLRITRERNIQPTPAQRPVEVFMQNYFRHSSALSEIVMRFVNRHCPRTLQERLIEFAVTHRVNTMFHAGPGWIDVLPRYRETVQSSLLEILKLYYAAALYGLTPKPRLAAELKNAVPNLSEEITPRDAAMFMQILGCTTYLGVVIRGLFDIGVLEILIPDFKHTRCLLQFNQYHSYTVDEHTLKAIECCIQFENDDDHLGRAYRAIQHKEILHLALLLHDVGKGFEEDHCIVGKRIAERIAKRLGIPAHRGRTLALLVEMHLQMADLAFRRDISDPAVVVPFAKAIGSLDKLRMLFVLTASDISAVGPGVWTDWKAGLLSEFYCRGMYVLSGRKFEYQEQKRFREIFEYVLSSITSHDDDQEDVRKWLFQQLTSLPPHYLAETSKQQIAHDLKVLQTIDPGNISVTGLWNDENEIVDYRLITHETTVSGVFHRVVGILRAKRLTVHSAQISTTADGYVVDSFCTSDGDYEGEVPLQRVEEISEALRTGLLTEQPVEKMFQKASRYSSGPQELVSGLPTRVVIDNNTSPKCTILDVFAQDQPGLLYLISRTLYELDTSVVLAKISTHFDQVVDVFYLTDRDGNKITDGDRLGKIREELEERLEHFEAEGHQSFC
ncbi:[protein-PII] uridylyltransferase [Thalassoroseus pseudoceratinae]|uniref:[protein-PII] uridylyltransferase n=1 Tax=Thalassoroseus pseudoceratinae TaxID=2713176 RepID=UPI001421A805|nr:[protein-PII] uridylyltransferase [Thalassoroseus pseudoceratinae]